jgi:RHS repeat-associated protein
MKTEERTMVITTTLKQWRTHSRALLALLCLSAVAMTARAVETITYYHLDALGSPVAATDEQGNLKWREDYKPYGEKIRNEPASASNSRAYTGHPHDNDTGLTYAGARYYDPVIGRFMAIDPKGFGEGNLQSFNRYKYGNNNPYKYVDPNGEAETLALCGGGPLACVAGIALTAATAFAALPAEQRERLGRSIVDGVGSLIFSEEKPSLVEPDRADHILEGDKTSGGHRAGTGKPGKSEFPSDWSDERVLGEISDVATDPQSSRQPGRGGREVVRGTRGGVDIEVIVDQDSKIITGYPTNVDRNPK